MGDEKQEHGFVSGRVRESADGLRSKPKDAEVAKRLREAVAKEEKKREARDRRES